ncbi:(2Fe-2S)-binding protein [Streptomyces sparsus]
MHTNRGSAGPDDGFFALRVGPPPAGAVPLASVYRAETDTLRQRISTVNSRLAVREPRVGASIAFLGLAARLWSVALAPAALDAAQPDLSPERLHWSPASAPGDDLWLPTPGALPRSDDPPGLLRGTVLDDHLVPLVAAVRTVTPVAEPLLWGNAASALSGALAQLAAWCRAHEREAAGRRAARITVDLLAHAPLRGSGTLTAAGFRRRTCCLYYRAPGGGLCGDCVFPAPPEVPRR